METIALNQPLNDTQMFVLRTFATVRDEQEKEDLFKMLKTDNTFDYVISHTGPEKINKYVFRNFPSYIEKSADEVAVLNDKIHDNIHFKEWWCGHWHDDNFYFDKKTQHGYQYLYRTTKIIEKKDNNIIITNEYNAQKR